MSAIQEYTPPAESPDIWSELNLPDGDDKLRELINIGFDIKVLSRTASFLSVSNEIIANAIRLAPTTFARRKKYGRLNPDESDRAFRLIKVADRAIDLFEGDVSEAMKWMNKPAIALDNKKPIEMLGTSAETIAVLKLIDRIEYGVYS